MSKISTEPRVVAEPISPLVYSVDLGEYLSTQPGGAGLERFLQANVEKDLLIVGSVAEMVRGITNLDILEQLQSWWKSREEAYPFRKTEVNDLDMFVVTKDGTVDWQPVPGVEVKQREMKDGKTMVLVGEDVPEPGDHFARRDYYAQKTWAEIVPLDIREGAINEQLQRQGYTQYTAVGVVGEEMNVHDRSEEMAWAGRNSLNRIKPVNRGTWNSVLGKDSKYLKLAVKSLVNVGLAYGSNIPEEIRSDLVGLLRDRVEMINEDALECRGGCAFGMLKGDLQDMVANNSYLLINVVERMIDGWVVLGNEATEIYRESGLLSLLLGVNDQESGNTRQKILATLESAVVLADYQNAAGQQGRLKQELEGLRKLFADESLEI